MPQQSAEEPSRRISKPFQTRPRRSRNSIKGTIGGQNEAAKKHLTEAVTHLEATQKHAAESQKSSGEAFHTSIKKVVADARAAVQKISEAVAAKRSAASKQPKK